MKKALDEKTVEYLQTFRHVFLYSKGHYEKKDTIQDLSRILSQRNCLCEAHISASFIMEALVRIVYPLIKNSEYYFVDFMTSISPHSFENVYRSGVLKEGYSYEHAVIAKCLSFLRQTRVKDNGVVLLDLGCPDPEILPISKNA